MRGKEQFRKGKRKRRLLQAGFAIALVCLLGVSTLFGYVMQANAAEYDRDAKVDAATMTDWHDTLVQDTSNVGRIWTDKSVSTDDVQLTNTAGEETLKIEKTEGADFLVSLSALSSASSMTSTNENALDIVLVLDQSGSMAYNFQGSNTSQNTSRRQYAMKQAVDQFIDAVYESSMEDGEGEIEHRLGIVTYGSNASVLSEFGSVETNYNSLISDVAGLPDRPSGSTNTGAGMNTAANMLPEKDEERNRVVILFTDGVPTTQSSFSDNVANTAIAAAHTMKEEKDASVYSIGIFNDADASYLGDIGTTWSGGSFWGGGLSDNQKANRFMNLVSSNALTADDLGVSNSRIDNNFDCDTSAGYYRTADNAEDLNNIFEDIFGEISEGSGLPTEVLQGYTPDNSGYITFEDELGSYMEVKDFNAIVFAGEMFEKVREESGKDGATGAEITRYIFEGQAGSTLYPNGNLSNIIIEVQKGGDLKTGDFVTVKIPASLIPVRYYNVEIEDGEVTLSEITETYPIRVFYSAGLREDVDKILKDGGKTDSYAADYEELLSYISQNRDENGANVLFYSNAFDKESGLGLTTATFTPSDSNSFYYYTKQTPLYVQSGGSYTPATAGSNWSQPSASTTYYYQKTIFEFVKDASGGMTAREKVIYEAASGENVYNAYQAGDVVRLNGVWTVKAGTEKMRRDDFIKDKDQNTTETASYVRYPQWTEERDVQVSLGNNGRIAMEISGILEISKTVENSPGFTAPADAQFTFELELTDAAGNGLKGAYRAVVTDAAGQQVGDVQSVSNGSTVKLTAGQKMTIYGLSDQDQYNVKEVNLPGGFEQTQPQQNASAAGTIAVGETAEAEFVNEYHPAPAELEGDTVIRGSKILNGRDMLEQETFTFTLTPNEYTMAAVINNEVDLPSGADGGTGAMTVHVSGAADGEESEFTFSGIRFKKPGDYVFEMTETGTDDKGLVFDKHICTVTVKVTLNQNTGKLEIAEDGISYSANGNQPGNLFVNTYTAQPVTTDFSLGGTKTVVDDVGNYALKAGDFSFTLTPVGQAPLPAASAKVTLVEQTGQDGSLQTVAKTVNDRTDDSKGTFDFTNITFTQEGVYQYYISEDQNPAWAGGPSVIPGMHYDESFYLLTVRVEDNDSGQLVVADVQAEKVIENGQNVETDTDKLNFTNTYEAGKITGTTRASKEITGRAFKENDSFTFRMDPDPDTRAAIEAGDIEMPQDLNKVEEPDGTFYYTCTIQPKSGTTAPINFGTVSYNKVGNYSFKVSEVKGNDKTITYDTKAYDVEVVISSATVDGALVLQRETSIKESGTTDDTTVQVMAFTNAYAPAASDAFTPVSVYKKLDGNRPVGLQDQEFSFRMDVSPVAGSPADGFILSGTEASNGSYNDQDKRAEAVFSDITFTKVGTYQVSVSEIIPDTEAPFMEYDSHTFRYTVSVTDNNGKLEAEVTNKTGSDTFINTYNAPENTKDVVRKDDPSVSVDGKMVGVGDELTYTIHWVNDAVDASGKSVAAGVKITDVIPEGTRYVAGSATSAGTLTGNELTWDLGVQDAGATGTVSFSVEVTENAAKEDPVTNQASVEVGSNGPKQTNEVTSYVPQKEVEGVDSQQNAQVGDVLTYTIHYRNTEDKAAQIVITDTLSTGLSYVQGSATGNGFLAEGQTLRWTLTNVAPGESGTVTFQARVLESAIQLDHINNQATVKVGDDPAVNTNVTGTNTETGSLTISKTIELTPDQGTQIDTDKVFRFYVRLTGTDGRALTGSYAFNGTSDGSESYSGTLNGAGWIYLKHGGSVTISGLPEGASYTVTEQSEQGYTSKAQNGAMSGTVTANGVSADFVNVYQVQETELRGAANLNVTKELTGREWKDEDSFTFRLTGGDAATLQAINDGKILLPQNASGIEITGKDDTKERPFDNITFKTAGDFVFHITEEQGIIGGIDYDTSDYDVIVSVTDNGSGRLTARVVQGANPVITNVYAPSGTVDVEETDIRLEKVLRGRDWSADDSFQFEIKAVSGPDGMETANIPMPAEKIVTVEDATETDARTAIFGFGPITYSEGGTYVYEVRELPGQNPGMKYADTVARIQVQVTDNLSGGWTAAVTVENGTFVNTYGSELDYDAQGGLTVEKKLLNHDMKADQFTFTVKAKDEASARKASITDGLEKTFANTEAVQNGQSVSTSLMYPLAGMTFTQEDDGETYTYEISENQENRDGYAYDKVEYTVAVSVKDDTQGHLTVTTHVTGTDGSDETWSYTDGQITGTPVTLTFENSYAANGSLGEDGDVSLEATKTLLNGQMKEDDYTFNIINARDDSQTVIAEGTNDAKGKITFEEISYTMESLNADAAANLAVKEKDGDSGNYRYIYQYHVIESGDLPAGVTQVNASFDITVTVTDKGDGTLDVKVTYPDGGLNFVNRYGAGASAEVYMKGSKVLKVLSGDNAPDITGKYTFTLTGENGALLPENTSVKNTDSVNVDFGKIVYDMSVFDGVSTDAGSIREKTLTYTIREEGNVDGVDNDTDAVKTVKVTLTDNGDGTMSVKTDPATGPKFEFTNTYSVDPVSSAPTDGSLKITKELSGRDMKAGEFLFEMTDDQDNVVSTGENKADGTIAFTPVTFEEQGTYQYQIREVNGKLGGVDYDTAVYAITASVTDNGDGTLAVEWTADEGEDAVFHNAYTAVSTSVSIGASKGLDGRTIKDGEFSFVLKDQDGKVISEAVNDETGAILFDAITYDQAGTYRYTLSEMAGDDPDIIYDDSVFEIAVKVTDDGEGHLTAQIDTDGKTLAFCNVYQEPEVTAGPWAPKTGELLAILPILLIIIAGSAVMIPVVRKKRR